MAVQGRPGLLKRQFLVSEEHSQSMAEDPGVYMIAVYYVRAQDFGAGQSSRCLEADRLELLFEVVALRGEGRLRRSCCVADQVEHQSIRRGMVAGVLQNPQRVDEKPPLLKAEPNPEVHRTYSDRAARPRLADPDPVYVQPQLVPRFHDSEMLPTILNQHHLREIDVDRPVPDANSGSPWTVPW
jgi:hypothetical protein